MSTSAGGGAADPAALRARLRHVHWIGGGSGAGKSTVARHLAATRGMHLYSTDDAMSEHVRRSTPDDSPLLFEFLAADADERWLHRFPQTMLETFHWFRGEGFDLIVDDLLDLPREPPVIVEGFRLLPRLVQPLLAVPGRAVWLLPTPRFRRAAFEHRDSTWQIVGRTSDPGRALHNLRERDGLFTRCLRDEVRELGLRAVDVDTGLTEAGLIERVTAALGL